MDWELGEKMAAEGKSAPDIARALGCSAVSVRSHMKKRGIQLTHAFRPILIHHKEVISRMAADGHSASEIAREYGVFSVNVSYFCKVHGIDLKNGRTRAFDSIKDTNALRVELLRRFSYDPESGELRYRAGPTRSTRTAGRVRRDGYLTVIVGGKHLFLHRVIWLMVHGELPRSIDHVNGIRSDNRLANLRPATPSENSRNLTRPFGGVPYKGVTYVKHGGKFQAQITAEGKTQYLGWFEKSEDAARAYDAAAIRLFGPFAKTNADLGLLHA